MRRVVTRAYRRGGLKGAIGQSLRYASGKLDRFDFNPYQFDRPNEIRRVWNNLKILSAYKTAFENCTYVPFRFDDIIPRDRIGVFLHVFYTDLFDDILSKIEISGLNKCALFISTDTDQKRDIIGAKIRRFEYGEYKIKVVENRGRDIYPKYFAFSTEYERFEFFVHLHTKKSAAHGKRLDPWRDYLLSHLIGSFDVANSNLTILRSPEVGIVHPPCFPPAIPATKWGRNGAIAQRLAQTLGITLDLNEPFEFPAGSMYMGRTQAIKPLIDLELTSADFEPELNQDDGTLHHTIERFVSVVCRSQGFRCVKTANGESTARTLLDLAP